MEDDDNDDDEEDVIVKDNDGEIHEYTYEEKDSLDDFIDE